VYGDNAMSDDMARKRVWMFNEGRQNLRDGERSGRRYLVNDDLVRKVNERVLTTDFSQFLICPCTFLRFQGLYSMTLSVVIWVIGKCVQDGCPRCLQRSAKKQRVACGLTFLMRYHKERGGMLSHIVTGGETWVSHIIPESKQQSLHWKHTGSYNSFSQIKSVSNTELSNLLLFLLNYENACKTDNNFNLLAPEFIFLILARSVYKM